MTYFTAKQAGEVARAALGIDGNFLRADTDAIFASIKHVAGLGRISMQYGYQLDPVIVARLEHLEYKVDFQSDQRDGDRTTISW